MAYVYILANTHNTVLYVGITTDLARRLQEHRSGISRHSFVKRYNVTKLVWYDETARITDAIAEEKRIKGGSREKKEALINKTNPLWKDLADDFL